MLSIVEQHASHAPESKLRAGLGKFNGRSCRETRPDMHDGDVRPIPDGITLLLNALAQVDLLVIEEEARSKGPDAARLRGE